MHNDTLRFLKLFALGYATFAALDILFLGYLMKGVYQSEIGNIARTQNGQLRILLIPGSLVWALIVIGAIILFCPDARASRYARCLLGSFLSTHTSRSL